jgi:hypothetical protein
MPVIDQFIDKNSALYNADTLEVLPHVASESIDLSIYSPP